MESEPLGPILASEVLEALETGEIIEDYPEDRPYPSGLVLGRTRRGRPLHVVCAPVSSQRRLIIITTYQPDPARWDAAIRRRKGP